MQDSSSEDDQAHSTVAVAGEQHLQEMTMSMGSSKRPEMAAAEAERPQVPVATESCLSIVAPSMEAQGGSSNLHSQESVVRRTLASTFQEVLQRPKPEPTQPEQQQHQEAAQMEISSPQLEISDAVDSGPDSKNLPSAVAEDESAHQMENLEPFVPAHEP